MEGATTINLPMWIFEFAIFGFLILDGVLVAELIASLKKASWRWLKIVAMVLAIVAWGVIFYGSFIEPKMLQVEASSIDLDIEGIEGELDIVVVSDIHVGPYKKARWSDKVVEKLNELDADMILMPGDFVFSKTEQVEMLESHQDIELPVYAVLGNHDHEFADPDVISSTLEGWGMNMLRNRAVEIELADGNKIDVAGIDDLWFTANPMAAMETVDDNTPTIMISHNPDFILEPEADRVDLVISGHTHCGQIRLPWIGSVPPIPNKLGRDWDCGEYDYGDGHKLFVTPGVGETGPRARLFNPPTINIIHVTY